MPFATTTSTALPPTETTPADSHTPRNTITPLVDTAIPIEGVTVDTAAALSGTSDAGDVGPVGDAGAGIAAGTGSSPGGVRRAGDVGRIGAGSTDGGSTDGGSTDGGSTDGTANPVDSATPADTVAPAEDGDIVAGDGASTDVATSGGGDSADGATRTDSPVPAAASHCATTASDGVDDVLLARAYLLRVAEPPAPHLARFVAEQGPVAAAEQVRSGTAPGPVLEETAARHGLRLAEQDLAAAAAVGARLLTPEDPEWPAWPFVALSVAQSRGAPWAGPPLALWLRGTAALATCTERAVAVVGARSASAYGEHVAAELGHGLTTEGITVVSGAAYGIDGAAHRGALTAEGPTVAVLGCGIDKPYPAGHATLLDRIADVGAVVSEYPPGTPPAKHRFLVRNRLIAALAAGVVVVEAGRRSGTRNTAATAAALGRLVMAVPGPVSSAMSVGCHDLLRTADACLVTSVADIAEAVGRIGVDLAPRPETDERRATDSLDDRSLRVHEALNRRVGLSAEQVAVRSGVPLDRVRAVLPALELMGLAQRCESGWRGNPTQT
jgi:DNA processing protein